MRKTLITAAILAIGLAACGSATPQSFGDGKDEDRPILRVRTAGGFVPPGTDLAYIPEFTLTADGQVIVPGPQIEIYPGPALPSVNARTITKEGIDAIVRAAKDAGIAGKGKHYDNNMVADAGTTKFSLYVDGELHEVTAYALGMEAQPADDEETRSGREKLAKFRENLGNLEAWLPAGSLGQEKQYEPEALRIVSRDYAGQQDVPQKPVAWPVDGSLGTFGDEIVEGVRCGTVEGADVESVLEKAREANQLTPWASEGEEYALQFRPLLPGETGCEEDEPGPTR